MLSVRFWGVRGSISCPGPDTVVYGGNTSCLEIRAGGKLVIVDLGTGVRGLGNRLIKQSAQGGAVEADIFITHTHWDHIMGFPVFSPVFLPNTRLRILGPASGGEGSLERTLSNQLSYDYWPVRLDQLAARIDYVQIGPGTLDLGGGLSVVCAPLNHSIPTLGYRFEYQGKSIVTAYDTEPYGAGASGAEAESAREEYGRFLDFIRNADVLIYDCMYTGKEYLAGKAGWGHSSFEEAIKNARLTGVKKLVCSHHDPNRTDRQLEVLERRYRTAAAKHTGVPAERPVNLVVAREGTVIRA